MKEAMHPVEGEVIALDVGEKRIGVARVHSFTKLPEPLEPILTDTTDSFEAIRARVNQHEAVAIVCGLPRGLHGDDTQQTQTIRAFIDQLKQSLDIPIYAIDEAGTSKEAEIRMQDMKATSKDSVAAMIIAEDFVNNPKQEELLV